MVSIFEEYVDAFDAIDAATRDDRATRAAWIASLGAPEDGWGFPGGPEIAQPWDELRRTFVEGSYLASILVGQVFLENLVAGELERYQDQSLGHVDLANALIQIRDRGWVDDLDYRTLDGLRKMRNPYAHFRNLHHPDSLTRRAMANREAPDVILERDARAMVMALFDLVNRRPFALGSIVYPDDVWPSIHPNQMQLDV